MNIVIKALKYIVLCLVLALCVMLDCSFFKELSLTRHLQLSLVICVCFSLYAHDVRALFISAACGVFCDFYSLSMPHFSLLYLYISLGCVWCEGLFLSLKKRTVFLISLAAFFVFWLSAQVLNLLMTKEIALTSLVCTSSLAFSFVNAAASPVIYWVLKRMRI